MAELRSELAALPDDRATGPAHFQMVKAQVKAAFHLTDKELEALPKQVIQKEGAKRPSKILWNSPCATRHPMSPVCTARLPGRRALVRLRAFACVCVRDACDHSLDARVRASRWFAVMADACTTALPAQRHLCGGGAQGGQEEIARVPGRVQPGARTALCRGRARTHQRQERGRMPHRAHPTRAYRPYACRPSAMPA